MSLIRLKRAYWRLVDPETSPVESLRDVFRSRDVDLARMLVADRHWECGVDSTATPEDGFHLSTPLRTSPHVTFLEQYQAKGHEIFAWRHFEKTAYFRHAMLVVAHAGHYFHSHSPDGILRQAKYFTALYESVRTGSRSEVACVPGSPHSSRGLPIVCETLTPGTTQILDGQHRLAVSWAIGKRRDRVIVRPPRPTELQRLVVAAAKARGIDPRRRELLQPIEAPEFDGSWPVVGRCEEWLQAMRRVLSARGSGSASLLDMGCDYGWFVTVFARAGWEALGVDRDAAGLKVGRSVYGLGPAQLVEADVMDFLRRCGRRFDVVLCPSPRRVCGSGGGPEGAAAIVEALDRVTGSVLFLVAGPRQEGEHASLARLLKERTRFTHVMVADVPAESAESPEARPGTGATLLACMRS